jgi:hypothetical protein
MNWTIFFNVVLIFFVLGLYVQFVIRTNRVKRSLPFFPTALFILVVFVFNSAAMSIYTSLYGKHANWLSAFQLTLSGIGIVLMYLFEENIISYTIEHIRFSIVCSLGALHIVFQWLIVYYGNDSGAYWDFLWLISMIPFYSMSIFVFGLYGLPIWIKIFKKTEAGVFLWYILAFSLITVGQSILLISDILSYVDSRYDSKLEILDNISNGMGFVGLVLIYTLIALNFTSLYRFPHRNYALMITNHAGVVLYFVKFADSHGVEIQEDLVGGFLSAVHSMFNETLKSKKRINLISSGDASIFMEHGKYSSVIFLAERISGIVAGEMRRFLSEFEDKFNHELSRHSTVVSRFESTLDLIRVRFPFLEIDLEAK